MHYPNMTDEEKREAKRELVVLVWLRHRERTNDVLRDLIPQLDEDLNVRSRPEDPRNWINCRANDDPHRLCR